MIIYPINKRKVSASGKIYEVLEVLAARHLYVSKVLAACHLYVAKVLAARHLYVSKVLAARHLYVSKVLAAHHLYVSKVLAARKKNLTTFRARKNKHTIRMLANARKDHSILLIQFEFTACELRMKKSLKIGAGKLIAWNDIIFCSQEVTFLREEKPFFRNPSTRDVPIPSAQRNSLVVQS